MLTGFIKTSSAPAAFASSVISPLLVSITIAVVIAMFKRADEPTKLHFVYSRELIAEQNEIVRLTPSYLPHSALSIIAGRNSPAEFLEDLSE